MPGGARKTAYKAGEVNLFQVDLGKRTKIRAGHGRGRRKGGEEQMGVSKKPGSLQH